MLSASLGEDPAVVTLATSPLSPDARYVLSVNNVRDRARRPNIVAPNSRTPATHSGLLAHWKLDEGKGDAVVDCSGNGHLGILKNGPQSAAGRQGTALRFDGTRSYVETVSHLFVNASTLTGSRSNCAHHAPGRQGGRLDTASTPDTDDACCSLVKRL